MSMLGLIVELMKIVASSILMLFFTSVRSCHKMVLNSEFKQLFILGRYVDRAKREQEPVFKYEICSRVPTTKTFCGSMTFTSR